MINQPGVLSAMDHIGQWLIERFYLLKEEYKDVFTKVCKHLMKFPGKTDLAQSTDNQSQLLAALLNSARSLNQAGCI